MPSHRSLPPYSTLVPISFGSVRIRTPLVFPGQRVGILGGSFNPPHGGHLQASETALRRLGLDQLWWVVSPVSPHKSEDGLQSLEARMAACRKLVAHPRIKITGFEGALRKPYLTAVTIAFLKRRHPLVGFVWIMGADNMMSFHTWGYWRSIARAMPIAIADRPGRRLGAAASPAGQTLAARRVKEADATRLAGRRPPAWTLLEGPLSELSSTKLRASGHIKSR